MTDLTKIRKIEKGPDQHMVFKQLLGAFGIGGPSVDTVLHSPQTWPGETLTGEIRIAGGSHSVRIDHIALGLVSSMETEHSDYEGQAGVEFHHAAVTGAFLLRKEESIAFPFHMPLPWEMPITSVYGQHLRGMMMGLRTGLAVANVADASDVDPLAVEPLPAQHKVLEAFQQLGFQFNHADLEHGYMHGVPQELPFFQEIEFFPPPQYAGFVNEVELTFIAHPHGLYVILEADKRSGFFTPGQDVFGRFHVAQDEALQTDWVGALQHWLQQVIERRGNGAGSVSF